MSTVLGENKRIIQLDQFSQDDANRLMNDWQSGQLPWSVKWYIPLDYKKTDADGDTEMGTLSLPFNRVAMLDEYGKVPIKMLPGYVDEFVVGKMVITKGSGDTPDQYVFTRTDCEQGETVVYACPTRTGTQLKPDGRFIYIATTTTIDGTESTDEVQYRYYESGSTEKFVSIPQSLALKNGKGTLYTKGDTYSQIDINIGDPAAKGTGKTNPLAISSKKLIHCKSGVAEGNYFALMKNSGNTKLGKISVDSTGHIGGITYSDEYLTSYIEGGVTGKEDHPVPDTIFKSNSEMIITGNALANRAHKLCLPDSTHNYGLVRGTSGTEDTNTVKHLQGGHRYQLSMDILYSVDTPKANLCTLSSYVAFSTDDDNSVKWFVGDNILDLSVTYPQMFHVDTVITPSGKGTDITMGVFYMLYKSDWDKVEFNYNGHKAGVLRYSIRELL